MDLSEIDFSKAKEILFFATIAIYYIWRAFTKKPEKIQPQPVQPSRQRPSQFDPFSIETTEEFSKEEEIDIEIDSEQLPTQQEHDLSKRIVPDFIPKEDVQTEQNRNTLSSIIDKYSPLELAIVLPAIIEPYATQEKNQY